MTRLGLVRRSSIALTVTVSILFFSVSTRNTGSKNYYCGCKVTITTRHDFHCQHGCSSGYWTYDCFPCCHRSTQCIIYCSLLYYTILYYTILYYTILYYTILYYTILYYTILYYTILYYTILYYTILYYTILYYTILYYTIFRRRPGRQHATGDLFRGPQGTGPGLPPPSSSSSSSLM